MSCSLVGITVLFVITMSWFSLGRLRGANPSVAQVGRVKIVSTGGGRGVVEEKEEDYRQEQALQFLHHHFYGGQQKRVPGEFVEVGGNRTGSYFGVVIYQNCW